MRAPRLPDIAASSSNNRSQLSLDSRSHQSRPGVDVGAGRGVSQSASSGKYDSHPTRSGPDAPIASSSRVTSTQNSTLLPPPALSPVIQHSSPGRAVESVMGAPRLPDTATSSFNVYQQNSIDRCSQQSRPGVGVGDGGGVSQPALSGKYLSQTISRTPDGSSSSSLRIYYQNVRGLKTKIDDFFLAATECDYDIIILTETWLDDNILLPQLFGDSYRVYANNRNEKNSSKRSGGGVLIAVAARLDSDYDRTPVCDTLEQLWIRVTLGTSLRVCFGVIYLPPGLNRNIDKIKNHLESIGSVISRLNLNDMFIQFGDYNQAGLKWKPAEDGGLEVDPVRSHIPLSSSFLIDGFNLHGLTQINSCVNARGNCLDLALVNDAVLPKCLIEPVSSPLVPLDIAHPALEMTVEIYADSVAAENSPEDLQSYNFRKADYGTLSAEFGRVDWSFLETATDVDAAVDGFQIIVNNIFAEFVPLRRPPQKPPWSNATLRRLKRQKGAALEQYCNHRSQFFKSLFNLASKRYRSYNRRMYKRYVIRTQNDLRTNPKNFWSFVNSKRKTVDLPPTLFLDDAVATTSQEKCTLFATHFQQAFNTETASEMQVNEATRNTPNDAFECSLNEVDNRQVSTAISKLKLSYSVGPDGIPSSVIKRCSDALLSPLTTLFNMSLRQNAFPTKWKTSYMFPVHKKGDKSSIRNYRGITSLCACSKVFEIVVNDFLFVCCKSYISTCQHGFFPKRSVASNLVQFVSHCLQQMDAGAQIDAVYTDLKAAFDRVDHAILLKRLEKLGVSANFVAWFKSYLTGRILRVKIGNVESEIFINLSGVPQGSNLGPLLFILFVNELALLLTAGCRLFYADDLKIFTVVRSVLDCSALQRLLNQFNEWCVRNFLTISIEKCNIISFHRKLKPVTFEYAIAGNTLVRVTQIKDLGITLDRELKFNCHRQDIVSRANRQLGFIFRIADDFRDIACLRSLYCALVRSILEFCSVVWCPYQATWTAKIESVQRKFTRLALRRARNPAGWDSYEERCRILRLDTLEQRRHISQGTFVAKILTGEMDAPSILGQLHLYAPERQLRQRVFLQLATRNTIYGQHDPIRFMCSRFNVFWEFFDFNLSSSVFQHRARLWYSRQS